MCFIHYLFWLRPWFLEWFWSCMFLQIRSMSLICTGLHSTTTHALAKQKYGDTVFPSKFYKFLPFDETSLWWSADVALMIIFVECVFKHFGLKRWSEPLSTWHCRILKRCLHINSLLPDFGIAGHFIDRVVDVHCILDHCAILKHLDLFGHTGDGEVVTVTVKLNTEKQERIQSLIKIILLENVLQWLKKKKHIDPTNSI